MGSISRTARARKDLADIWRYIASDDSAAADRHARHLAGQFAFLADNSEAGRARPALAPALRSWPFGNYVIFDRPLPGGVLVVRDIHRARDLDREPWST